MQTYKPLIDLFIPTHYGLSLKIQRIERCFSGTVTINGSVPNDTSTIKFHAKELSIDTVVVNGASAEWSLDGDELSLMSPFVSGQQYIVVIGFNGIINDTMHGMYPCYYTYKDNKKELIATQFESHHAREVFPCIDEPAAKATFDVTLQTETGVVALSNMPANNHKDEAGQLVTTFDTTPIMSTYLLAWVIGELEATTGKTKDGVDVRIWSTPAQPAEARDFALDIAIRTTEFFDDYFGVPYPLPKADHVALPDFSSGAMENWGLITYREVALLVDPANSSIENRQQAALVIAHELSHQWFGNLVTMEWWNDLWLNESFANMMEYVAIDALEPNWNVWLDHAGYEVIQALRRDSLDGVQAIQSNVAHPDEINSLFDPSIVYAKGGRLLRMLQYYIGDEALRSGLKQYFTVHAYGNTVASDLWESLSAASGHNVAALMEPWIQQPGYPVVKVLSKDGGIELTQEQFFIGAHAEKKRLWPIPIASSNPLVPEVMTEQSLFIPSVTAADIQLNSNSPSHFIVHYDPSLLESVLSTITEQTPINRLKLLNEYSLLAQAEVEESASLLKLLEHYRQEQGEAVWGMISMIIAELKKFTDAGTKEETKLRQYVGALVSSQYQRLGWDQKPGEPENDTKLRSLIIGLMLYSENKAVIDEAQSRFENTPLEQLNPELRAGILSSVVRHSNNPELVDNLMATHDSSHSSELREDIAMAVTSSKDPAVLTQSLMMVKQGTNIRRQDAARWIVWTLRNRDGRAMAWQWIRDEWQWIEATFGSDKSFDAYPRYAASVLSRRQELNEYSEFFTPMLDSVALKRNITIGLTELEQRVGLIERQAAAVHRALLDL